MEQNKPEKKLSLRDSFEFKLRNPISYSEGGRKIPVDTVMIIAPGEKLCIQATKLQAMTMEGIMKSSGLYSAMKANMSPHELKRIEEEQLLIQESNGPVIDEQGEVIEEEEDVYEAGKSGKMILLASRSNIQAGLEEFQKLAMDGCVKVNNLPLNPIQWEELNNYDKLDMFYQFIGVFIQPSVL